MIDCQAEEIKQVAGAMVGGCIEYSPTGGYHWCLFCDAVLFGREETPLRLRHEQHCPVLIAERLMAGCIKANKPEKPTRKKKKKGVDNGL